MFDISKKTKILCLLFLGHFCGFLCFGRVNYGRMSDVNRSCFSPAVNFGTDICAVNRKKTERNKKTEGEICAFLERSALLLQRAKWLFTETRHSCFLAADALGGSKKQPQLWWRGRRGAESWGHTAREIERTEEKKEKR